MINKSLQTKNSSSSSDPYRVAVIGASGYGGIQTIRLLRDHPGFQITYLAGNRSVGKNWSQLCPFIPLSEDLVIQPVDPERIAENSDFVILSLPNGYASQIVPDLCSRNLRIVDLSADYRYQSLDQWSQAYSRESAEFKRTDSDIFSKSVYGLPEWYEKEINRAQLIASPGCYPTASLLPILPFLKQGLIETTGIIIDAKSGTSGGGRNPKQNLLLSECSESIAPYGVIGHRHTSEIELIASEIAGTSIQLQFTPHLVPMVRGILSTVYGRLRDPCLTAEDSRTVLEAFYQSYPCVEILPVGVYPSTKWVRNTNKALISVQVDTRTSQIIFISVIDNLIKGQAGQAIQSLNILANYPSEMSLPLLTSYP